MNDERLDIRGFVSDRAQAMARRLSSTVRPIVVEAKAGLDPIGSGVLLGLGNAKFLLTAAHVLDQRASCRLLLSTTAGTRPIGGEIVESVVPASGSREDDQVDVGVVRLSDTACEGVPPKDWIRASQTDVDEEGYSEPTRGSTYLVLGFMATRAKLDVAERRTKVPMFMLTSVAAPPEVYRKLRIDDESYLALEFDRRRVITPAGQQTAPRPLGISGGGIWGFRERQGGDPRLVAISIECHHKPVKALVGTRLAMFFEVIRSRWPELGSSIPRPRARRITAARR